MQENKLHNVGIIYNALKEHYKMKTLGELEEFLGLQKGILSVWKARNSIADEGVFITNCKGLSYKWLKTGEGPMFIPAIGDPPYPHGNDKFKQYSNEAAKAPTIAEQLHGYSAEIKWIADYMEIKTKGCTEAKRMEIAEEILDLVKKRTGGSE